MDESEIAELAKLAMSRHGLVGWSFQWEDSLPWSGGRLAGHCDWGENRIRLARDIVLGYDSDRIRYVIRHEIAHALCPPNSGHGEVWREKLRQVSCA